MKNIIYDFNGTIIDDVECCLECINYLIAKYLKNRKSLTIDEYRHIFTFPVKNYYEEVGFDFDILSWQEVGKDFYDYYSKLAPDIKVFPEALELLKENRLKGNKNIVLSATEINSLKKQLDLYNIIDYFDDILGIDNVYGTSKIPIAKEYMKDKNKEDYILLGDTLHDLEVAKEIGVECILVSSGHNAKDILLSKHDKVIDNLSEVLKCV